jgi:hypothetical protein
MSTMTMTAPCVYEDMESIRCYSDYREIPSSYLTPKPSKPDYSPEYVDDCGAGYCIDEPCHCC